MMVRKRVMRLYLNRISFAVNLYSLIEHDGKRMVKSYVSHRESNFKEARAIGNRKSRKESCYLGLPSHILFFFPPYTSHLFIILTDVPTFDLKTVHL